MNEHGTGGGMETAGAGEPIAAAGVGDAYPVTLTIDYPDRSLDRLTSFFRLIMLIPIIFLAATLSGSTWGGEAGGDSATIVISGVSVLFIPVLLMILFRQRYPRWWYDWNLNLLRFLNRIAAYAFLMDDNYPATDEEQSVHLDFPYPDVEQDLHRGLPLVKWLLAIPHYIVLVVLSIGAFFAVLFAWFAILFTGRYPRGLFGYVEGVMRWHNRVTGYAFTLVTDRYPPFRLGP